MKTIKNQIKRIALLGLIILTATLTTTAGSIVITLKNGQVLRYSTSEYNVVYVGAEYNQPGAIGVKIYPNGSTESFDYLFSQMSSFVIEAGEVATPVISPNGGTITGSTAVTIACATSGATIYYTTNGATPSSSSTRYTGAFTVSTTTTVKAIAIKDSDASDVATATFTYTSTDGNANANSKSVNWNTNNGSMSYTPKTAGFWRLEVPRISDVTTSPKPSWLQKSTSSYGVTYAVEWDNSKKANRWSCYQFHAGNRNGSTTGSGNFHEDSELPSSTRSSESNYKNSGYSKGHLCPSADRKKSAEQNNQTYYMGNMQPQWQAHNGGQWSDLEGDVRTWANNCDTLYVVKAATIDNVTLNGTTESGLFSTTYNGTTYSDLKCNGVLPVPKYFYMALLAYNKSTNTYQAIGIWTKHYNSGTNGVDNATHSWPVINKVSAEYITIDELETRTGIDFFCNLPDDVENAVEASLNTSYWSSNAPLNR